MVDDDRSQCLMLDTKSNDCWLLVMLMLVKGQWLKSNTTKRRQFRLMFDFEELFAKDFWKPAGRSWDLLLSWVFEVHPSSSLSKDESFSRPSNFYSGKCRLHCIHDWLSSKGHHYSTFTITNHLSWTIPIHYILITISSSSNIVHHYSWRLINCYLLAINHHC